MARVTFSGVSKVFPDGTRAVDDLDLDIADGEFMVLVGPSGCGKTTALRMVAGLEEVTEGEIWIDGKAINDTDPRKRDVAMVFQNYALYPHMSVYENIAFPLRSRRLPKAEIDQRVTGTAETLGLRDLLRRRPRALSGGQRQRVAMGRAIVRNAQVFLMDEPLSNLDAKLRVQMRAEISTLQRKLRTTTLYVTHDQTEAMTMGDRIAVMRRGVLQQQGSPLEVFNSPANLFVASFIGAPAMNLFCGRLERRGAELVCRAGDQELPLSRELRDRLADQSDRDLAVGARPDYLQLASNGDGLAGRVVLVEPLGSQQLVHVEIAADPVLTDEVLEVADDTDAAAVQRLVSEIAQHRTTVLARLDADVEVHTGRDVRIAIPQQRLHFFDLQTGAAIE